MPAMAFPESVKNRAFARSGGRCECKRRHLRDDSDAPHRDGRCTKTLKRRGEWHANHIKSDGPPVFSNCEVLCVPCYKLARP